MREDAYLHANDAIDDDEDGTGNLAAIFFLSVLLFLATGGKCLAVDLERNSDPLAEILLGGNLLEEGHVTAGQSLGARRVADAGGGVVA